MKKISLFLSLSILASCSVFGQSHGKKGDSFNNHKFSQLDMELPTPNNYRTASGAPVHQYWQQRADYDIKVELDDTKQKLSGEETITYTNNSPDQLDYLWLQLDQNLFDNNNNWTDAETRAMSGRMSFWDLKRLLRNFEGGDRIEWVRDAQGKDLPYFVLKTMMRVQIPQPLKAGEKISFKVKWNYNINDGANYGGRCGYEFFPKDSNYTYHIAQFFPRMCRYDDINGWQHKQYMGTGEFALSFGNYNVSITVPDDHIVGSTGELQNAAQVLTATQRERFEKSKTAAEPIVIVTQDEAVQKEKEKPTGKKTWTYKAENVRDFAFCTSRKFIWDAIGVKLGNRTVMCMSYYPKEGNPMWGQYSTKAVAHTVKTYSKYTFDYPYPVAISSNASFTGMEYPMISFNFGRCEADGTYSERSKNGMIGVIIHEVGHNWFPMIVNSDERQWFWMDEGLNTFVQFLTEREWDANYPSRWGYPANITDYMTAENQNPIMSNADVVGNLGANAYGKPCTALNILRETVIGRENFDYAFKTYCNRWKFKHPAPADFFRSMEDASGVDLDWFWRGWFYTTDHVDISIDSVKFYQINTKDPEVEKALAAKQADSKPKTITDIRNKDYPTAVSQDPSLKDFYSNYDKNKVDAIDREEYEKFLSGLSEDEKSMINSGKYFYQVKFRNLGGLVMPIIIKMEYADGTSDIKRIPAEVWRYNSEIISRVFMTDKEVVSFVLDPNLEMADANTDNNIFPREWKPSRFELYKSQGSGRYPSAGENPMQRQKKIEEKEKGK